MRRIWRQGGARIRNEESYSGNGKKYPRWNAKNEVKMFEGAILEKRQNTENLSANADECNKEE